MRVTPIPVSVIEPAIFAAEIELAAATVTVVADPTATSVIL